MSKLCWTGYVWCGVDTSIWVELLYGIVCVVQLQSASLLAIVWCFGMHQCFLHLDCYFHSEPVLNKLQQQSHTVRSFLTSASASYCDRLKLLCSRKPLPGSQREMYTCVCILCLLCLVHLSLCMSICHPKPTSNYTSPTSCLIVTISSIRTRLLTGVFLVRFQLT